MKSDEKRGAVNADLLGLVDVGQLGSGRLLADHRDPVGVLLSDLVRFGLPSL